MPGATRQHLDSVVPATGKQSAVTHLAPTMKRARRLRSATRAYHATSWRHVRGLSVHVRQAMADQFGARAGKLAALLSRENGKVTGEAAFEILPAAPGLRYCAVLIAADHGRASEWGLGRFSVVVREPVASPDQRAMEFTGALMVRSPGATGRAIAQATVEDNVQRPRRYSQSPEVRSPHWRRHDDSRSDSCDGA